MPRFESIPSFTGKTNKQEEVEQEKSGGFSEALKKLGPKALLLGSITASIFSATDSEGSERKNWEDFLKPSEGKTYAMTHEELEARHIEGLPQVEVSDLVGIEPEKREVLAERINGELYALNGISLAFTDAYRSNGGKTKEKDIFQMAQNARQFILDSGKTENKKDWIGEAANGAKKMFTALGIGFAGRQVSKFVHELGHRDAFNSQGIDANVKYRLFSTSHVDPEKQQNLEKEPIKDNDLFARSARAITATEKRYQTEYSREEARLNEESTRRIFEYASGLREKKISGDEYSRMYEAECIRVIKENNIVLEELKKKKTEEMNRIIAPIKKQISEINKPLPKIVNEKDKKQKLLDAEVNIAGINRTREMGDFLANAALGEGGGGDNQLLAIMSLVSRGDGMWYSLRTLYDKNFRRMSRNDIVSYSENTGTPIQELALGMAAEYFLNPENIHLLKIAAGQKGVKIPKTKIAPLYRLDPEGAVYGVKIKGEF